MQCALRYIAIWDLSDPKKILLLYVVHSGIFEKKSIEYKYVFRYSVQSFSETFFILRELSEI